MSKFICIISLYILPIRDLIGCFCISNLLHSARQPLGPSSPLQSRCLLIIPKAVKTEKAVAPHFSSLAWKIPWTEKLGRLQSMQSLSPTRSQTRLSDFTFTFHFHALEKEMATHSSVLAWRIPGTGEPGGLLSMRLQRVRHD